MPSADPIEKFKATFHRSQRFTHLNNAGIAPICSPARDAMVQWANRLHEEGTHCVADLFFAMEETRSRLGQFLNAPTQQIAFFQGTANAISQAAFGLDFRSGDEIVLWDQEYPSNFYPWRDAAQRAGARLVVARSGENLSTPLSALEACVSPRTRLIAFSWVQFQSGAITDLADIVAFARQRNILTFADIIQGAGVLPFDFAASGLDLAVGGSHKWMLSPLGAGFLMAKPEVFSRLVPQAVGAMTYSSSTDVLPSMTAQPVSGPGRYEPGSRPLIELAAFGAALRLFLETGIDRIAQEAEWLAKRLVHGLRERGYEIQSPHGKFHRGAIVNFKPATGTRHATLEALEVSLNAAGISHAKRAGGIRLSPHAFNTLEDIEKALAAVS